MCYVIAVFQFVTRVVLHMPCCDKRLGHFFNGLSSFVFGIIFALKCQKPK